MMEPHERLRRARLDAGYATASEATEAFGWNYATYSGHENGNRGITVRAAERYARALHVDVNWLLFGKRTPQVAFQQPDPGAGVGAFQNATAPFTGKTEQARGNLERIAAAAAPLARHTYLLELQQPYLDFGLCKGDILVADPNGKPRDGDVVLLNRVDPDTSEAITSLRRWYRGQMMPSLSSPEPNSDDADLSLMATLVASIRAPSLTG